MVLRRWYLQAYGLEVFSIIFINHTINRSIHFFGSTIGSNLCRMRCDCGAKKLYALRFDRKLRRRRVYWVVGRRTNFRIKNPRRATADYTRWHLKKVPAGQGEELLSCEHSHGGWKVWWYINRAAMPGSLHASRNWWPQQYSHRTAFRSDHQWGGQGGAISSAQRWNCVRNLQSLEKRREWNKLDLPSIYILVPCLWEGRGVIPVNLQMREVEFASSQVQQWETKTLLRGSGLEKQIILLYRRWYLRTSEKNVCSLYFFFIANLGSS